MKRHTPNVRMVPALVAAALCLAPAALRADQLRTQSFNLHPGWNAVYLEVTPQPADTASVFAGVPILSVWTWNPRQSPVDFIQDPSEGLFNRPGWLGYFPPGPDAVTNNLFSVEANRAYLVNLGGGGNVVWNVTGRPALDGREWVPNSFNLVGLPVDPASPPSFAAFFAASTAHAGQPVYRLDAAGAWQLIPASTPIQSGEAYWIYSQGGSHYEGPLAVELEQGDGLDYSGSLNELSVRLTNLAGSATTVSVASLPTANGVPLTYFTQDPSTNQFVWMDLPSPLNLPATAGERVTLRLAAKRAAMSGFLGESIVSVRDGRGLLRYIPVRAIKEEGLNVTSRPARKGSTAANALPPGTPLPPFAGLWVGSVSIDKVSRSQFILVPSDPAPENNDTDPNNDVPCAPPCQATQGTSLTPIPVKDPFVFRLILHVDENGDARLLKDVIQMWQNGTGTTPGHFVLVTDDALIPSFSGAALRDGEPVGRRISANAFDFPASGPNFALDLNGSLSVSGGGPSGTLDASFVLDKDAATNPFRHKYHPDHDNVGALGPVAEAYDVARSLRLVFSATDPDAPTGSPGSPEYGSAIIGGAYEEEFAAGTLHKNPIAVSGTFRLRRVSLTAVLNQ